MVERIKPQVDPQWTECCLQIFSEGLETFSRRLRLVRLDRPGTDPQLRGASLLYLAEELGYAEVLDETKKLVVEKLSGSGLTLNDAKRFGIILLDPKQTAKLFHHCDRPSFKLVYHDASGKERRDVYRVRLLGPEPIGAFGQKDEKPAKYLQQKGSDPAAYFPKTVRWKPILEDPTQRLLITEGELKACCAAKHGLACVGLGGVDCYMSARNGWDILPELDTKAINWLKRPVVIIFDSDGVENPRITAAASNLARKLLNRGALSKILFLPKLPGVEKTGLDDFLVTHSCAELEDLIEDVPDDDLARELLKFNDQFKMILNPAVVYDADLDALHDPGTFRSVSFAHRRATKMVPGAKNTMKLKEYSVADEWIRWEARNTLDGLTYKPGQPKIIGRLLNEWHDLSCRPKAGPVKLWSELLDHLFTGAPPEERRWFESWCLYPLKFLGVKMFSACNLWSRGTGIGKSLIGYTLGRIYGRNYSIIGQDQLESSFNGWMAGKQFIMLDDASPHDSRAKADLFKKYITQDQMQVNIKCLPTYQIPDHTNYYITSNQSNVLYLEEQDRRFFVHEVTAGKLPKAFATQYMAWIGGRDVKGKEIIGCGAGALLYYAQRKYDFGTFDPYVAPPMTEAKQRMIAAVRTDLGQWLADVAIAPEHELRFDNMERKCDLMTGAELHQIYSRRVQSKPVSIAAVTAEARNVFSFVPGGPHRINGAAPERFFIVRICNQERWLKATPAEIIAYVKAERAKEQGNHGRRY